ncbi:TetR/AcrR family transcriptional regulator [Amycolatopsis suaedae]|uniref:TetR/AcrR family transcriptional regulator n=1 Tax=Amycolatopsis suaedae TaxID=2510978 RepID=A0A4Q7JB43_9PSEU|nr:TetR/AcrR family transcriptional regulator [Amycolatopsis suaedae]RZQ64216.1 TetR/AcrR family transcriptional regulator [Amycolatopsis suaedae]
MRRTQQDRSAATRAALTAAARELFTERGYQAVPADEIVRAAGVTRGALYHHYGDKLGLFRAVFEEIEQEFTEYVRGVVDAAPDLATGLFSAMPAMLDACERPDIRRIALIEGPTVLGWHEWREVEAGYGLGLIVDLLERAIEAELIPSQPVDMLAPMILSAVMEAALVVANSADPARARADAERVIAAWGVGLMTPVDQAGPLP